jgi:hypothetical protein
MGAADLALPACEIVKDRHTLRGDPEDDLARVVASLHSVAATSADAIAVAANTHAVATGAVDMVAVNTVVAVRSLRSTKTGDILPGMVGSQGAVGLAAAVTSKACIAADPIVVVLR